MKYAYQVIDEPIGKTYYIEADSQQDAVIKICDQWEMLEDCIEQLEEAECNPADFPGMTPEELKLYEYAE
jgi:hypothetical protein